MDFSNAINELESLDTPTQQDDQNQEPQQIDPIEEALNSDEEFNSIAQKIEENTPKPIKVLKKQEVDNPYVVDEDKEIGAGEAFSTALFKNIASTINGVEKGLAYVASYTQNAQKNLVKNIGHILTGDFDSIHFLPNKGDVVKQAEDYRKALKVAKYINDFAGKKVVASFDDVIDYGDKVEDKVFADDSLLTKGAVIAGEVTGFLTSWEASLGKTDALQNTFKVSGELFDRNLLHHLTNGKTFEEAKKLASNKRLHQHTFGDIAKVNTAVGVQTGVVASGEGKEADDALKEAAVAVAFGSVLSTAMKGVGGAVEHWHPFSATGTKLRKGLVEDAVATTYRGKVDALYKDMEEFGKMSIYGSWDKLPEMTKILWLSSRSESGQAKITNAMKTDSDVFDSVMNNLRNLEGASKDMLSNIVDVAKLIEKGHKMLPHEVPVESPTYLQDILTEAGFIKGVKATAKKDLFGKEWEILSATLQKDEKEATRLINTLSRAGKNAIEALKTGISDAMNGLPPKPQNVRIDDLKKAFLLRLQAKREGKNFDDVLKGENITPDQGLDITDIENVRGRSLHKEWDLVQEAIESEVSKTNYSSGYLKSVDLTPYDLYKIYNKVKNNLALNSLNENKLFDAEQGKHITDTILDLLDELADGAKYKDVLKTAVKAQAYKRDVIDKLGLAKLMQNKAVLTPEDVRNFMLKLAHTSTDFKKEYKNMLESLNTPEQQVEVETSLIKALALSRDYNLRKFANREGVDGSESYLKGLEKANVALESFTPITREGRVLQESLKAINQVTNGLINISLGTEFERSIVSEIRVGIGQWLHRIIGSVQTNKGAVNNNAYVASKLKKLHDTLSEDRVKSPISGESVLKHYTEKLKNGELILGDKGSLKTSVEISRMIANLNRLKGVSGNGDITKPYTTPPSSPTPPTPPSSPTPPTPPTPAKGLPTQAKNSIVEYGHILDTVYMTNADLANLRGKQRDLVEQIIQSKGRPPVAHETDEWIAFNKKLTELSKGEGHRILIDPIGKPQLVVGEKGVRLNPEFSKKIVKERGGFSSRQEYSLYDILDKDSLKDLLQAFDAEDTFDDVVVKFVRQPKNEVKGRLSAKWLDVAGKTPQLDDFDVTMQINLKHWAIPIQGEERVKSILSTVLHEMRHHLQHTIDGVPVLSKRGDVIRGRDRSLYNTIIEDIRTKISSAKVDKDVKDYLQNILQHTGKRSVSALPVKALIRSPETEKIIDKALKFTQKSVEDWDYMSYDDREGIIQTYIDHLYQDSIGVNIINEIKSAHKFITDSHSRYLASDKEVQARFVQAIMENKALTGDTDILHKTLQDFADENKDILSWFWTISDEGDTAKLTKEIVQKNQQLRQEREAKGL